jgi:alpha-N-arabinofuranosidase
MHASNFGRGTALRAVVDSPVYDCKDYTDVPYIDATATMDDAGNVTVFCVNRDMSEDYVLNLDLRSFGALRLEEHILLHHDDVKAVNTEDCPDRVTPHQFPISELEKGSGQVCLPALSRNVLRFRP